MPRLNWATNLLIIAPVVAFVLCAPGSAMAEVPRESTGYRVIVHPRNRLTSIERRFLADVFLKKTSLWPNGDVVHPVDLASDSPVRRKFSEDAIERTVPVVKVYWQQVIFSGRGLPPPEFEKEEDVVAYVLQNAGAIGYVSDTVDVGAAKILAVR